MAYNLLSSRWLPVRRADGSSDHVAPWQIAEIENPVVSLAAPRPDFNGALMQFLVGLLQTTFAPESSLQWSKRFDEPPAPESLQAAFDRYRQAFELDGDGPRFMQDLDPLAEQKPLPITALLIDTAGSETHFIKHLPADGLAPAVVAMALYTLQTNAPAGGAGNRTSLRGGGPLSTLVVAASATRSEALPLWQTLWLNVLERSEFDSGNRREEDIFPWLAPTRTSDKFSATPVTTPDDVNPLQMFWGMPRRIRLDLERVGQGECGISGEPCEALVRQYRARNHGVNYDGSWQHTLSPHNRDPSGIISAVHPRGSIHYRHWLGLVQQSADKKIQRVPARTVSRFLGGSLGQRKNLRFRVWAYGYDMDNMKPRCWYEGTLPLFHLDDAGQRRRFEGAVENVVRAAGEFLGNLRSCLKDAWFDKEDPRRKSADLSFLDSAFWPETESTFYEALDRLHRDPGDVEVRRSVFRDWHSALHAFTLGAFHRHADTTQIAEQDPRRIARAYRDLRRFNYKKEIKILLEMPLH